MYPLSSERLNLCDSRKDLDENTRFTMKKILLGMGALLIILTIYFLFFSFRDSGMVKGSVVRNTPAASAQWGIKTNKGLFTSILSVDNLPLEFQEENLIVRCNYRIVDVIGSNLWGTVVEVRGCKKI